ncbi:alpha-galactosidase [Streptomyces sp. ST1015]|uniref:alpha-galactosidase n=1 Tax=Streptomyces sp. ST1020 TaxID=1848901 RepID=UPI001CA7147F|nr:alpha-galactosidase [Streptomyces sp. ST1015]QZZ31718.1 alpha-galactosidase [Streptomyces sp. ST1015]
MTGTVDGLVWGSDAVEVEFGVASDGTPRVVRVGADGKRVDPDVALPLVELTAFGWGSGWSGPRFTGTALGNRLRYRGHSGGASFGGTAGVEGAAGFEGLTVELHDSGTGLTAFVEFGVVPGVPVLRSRVRLRNDGREPLVVQSVSSLILGVLPPPRLLDVHWARNDWLAECRWESAPVRDVVADIGAAVHQHDSRAAFRLTGRGSWPTDGHLAMGALTEVGGGRAWLWQIESPAGWRWDLGERDGLTYLALNGPTDAEHQWRVRLGAGESFTTVPVALAVGAGFDAAMGALTSYRRAVRRPHADHVALPVVFNDYMNTLMGDPTSEKLYPLVDAAARAGAEYFCIDSGWYDDDADGWWDSVGAWEPSARRFPDGGIQRVLERIRERGMVPGLWLEPEVVGVRSPVARQLPGDAFFQRDGIRLTEQGRHQLDLRHPAARAHLDRTVDRIVGEWGVGYLKLDYNIVVDPGTVGPGDLAPGAGLLGHGHAYLSWLSEVLDRHPGLVVESCASGGMRMDGATLAVSQLQSTSDQQDPLRYPPIAASAPTAAPPEQGAVWAYPQPSYSDELISFTLGGALLGRVHLSGHLDRMSDRQMALVRGALDTYKAIRGDLARGLPFWPVGLPGWGDEWVVLGVRVPGGATYLSVWRRGGEGELRVPVEHLAGTEVGVEVLHPGAAGSGVAVWDGGGVVVSVPWVPGVVLLRLAS